MQPSKKIITKVYSLLQSVRPRTYYIIIFLTLFIVLVRSCTEDILGFIAEFQTVSYRGYVYDEKTRIPIKDVTITVGSSHIFGSSSGFFEISIPKRHFANQNLKICKAGYKPFEIEIDFKTDTRVIKILDKTKDSVLKTPIYFNKEHTSYLQVWTYYINSTHFEYSKDTLKIYLQKEDWTINTIK